MEWRREEERRVKEAPSAAVASEEGEFLQQALQRPSLPSPPQRGHSVRPSVHPSIRLSVVRDGPHRGRYAMVAANSAPPTTRDAVSASDFVL